MQKESPLTEPVECAQKVPTFQRRVASMGLSHDTVSNIIYVFGVSCAIPCAFFLVCSTPFPAVSVRSALVVFHLAFHDSINVNANFRKVVENTDDAVHHLNGNSLRLC